MPQVHCSRKAVRISNFGQGAASWALRMTAPEGQGSSLQSLPDWLAACPAAGLVAPQVQTSTLYNTWLLSLLFCVTCSKLIL